MPRGVLVAHTPALPHHAQIRAQKVAEFSMVSTVYTHSMGTHWVWLDARRYLTFAVVFESQVVAVVRRLVPVTSTATYLPRWDEVSL